MRVQRFHDPALFDQRVRPLLMRNEANNNLILGMLAEILAGTRDVSQVTPLYCAIENEVNETVAAVMSTGPRLILTDADNDAIAALIDHLAADPYALPAACGPADTALRFSRAWAAKHGLDILPSHRMAIMQLDRVVSPGSAGGTLRMGTGEDLPLLEQWGLEFVTELKMGDPAEAGAVMRRKVEQQNSFHLVRPAPGLHGVQRQAHAARNWAQLGLHTAAVSQARICPHLRRAAQPAAAGSGQAIRLSVCGGRQPDDQSNLQHDRL